MIKAQYNCTSYGIIIILLKLLQKRETMLSQTTFFTPLYDIGIISILQAHATERKFIPYFWRQAQLSTITRIKTLNDCHLPTIRYYGTLHHNTFESDDFWRD